MAIRQRKSTAMKQPIEIVADAPLRSICVAIVATGFGTVEWADRESDDWFQDGPYTGGYDATESAFCFEVTVAGQELWFQFTLEDARRIAAGERLRIEARPRD